MERAIIEIDEERCNGCGQCITDCAEGALAIVDGKAKLISEAYCDGLGACLNCPQGALTLRMRNAKPFDEAAAMQAKLKRESGGLTPLIPKSSIEEITANAEQERLLRHKLKSRLRTWPIQLELMPARADYLKDADILLAAQCAGFALPNIHEDWMAGRIPLIACPKLENKQALIERLGRIIAENDIKSLTLLRMSVPCCDLEHIAREAIAKSGRKLNWQTHVVPLR